MKFDCQQSDKKIRLRKRLRRLVLLGIRLHPKTSDSDAKSATLVTTKSSLLQHHLEKNQID